MRAGAFTPTRNAASAAQVLDDTRIHLGGEALADFFVRLMQARINFVITGSTSSGKTAFLNMLAQYIPEWERVVTIEDTQELQIKVLNWLAFEANPTLGVDIRALVKHALRNRPNRILVGEARGPEMFDILDAYNTGHPGSAVTFHSNSAAQALPRLENMVRMAPEASNWPLHDLRAQIASTFGYVIHCSNAGGIRGPVEVQAIRGCDNGQYQLETLFQRT
jgi:Flp pilus assembly CpaF family ATPase